MIQIGDVVLSIPGSYDVSDEGGDPSGALVGAVVQAPGWPGARVSPQGEPTQIMKQRPSALAASKVTSSIALLHSTAPDS